MYGWLGVRGCLIAKVQRARCILVIGSQTDSTEEQQRTRILWFLTGIKARRRWWWATSVTTSVDLNVC